MSELYLEDWREPNIVIPIPEVIADTELRPLLFSALRKAYDEHKHSVCTRTCQYSTSIKCDGTLCADRRFYQIHSDECEFKLDSFWADWFASGNEGDPIEPECICDPMLEEHWIDIVSPESVIPIQFVKLMPPHINFEKEQELYWVRFNYGPHPYCADYGITAEGIAHCWAD